MATVTNNVEQNALPTRALFRQPLALQWQDHGKFTKRKEGERTAGMFELFLDLLFVALLANLAEGLAEHVNGYQLVKYILVFVPAWHVWSDLRELMNSFYVDDLVQRCLILWIMAVLVVYGNNANFVDEEDLTGIRATVGSYMVARFSATMAHLATSFASYHHRVQQRIWVVLTMICLCLYIPLFFEEVSLGSKVAVAFVAEIAEECVWVFTYHPIAKKLFKVQYSTAVDLSHEIDRFGAFFIIVLGEFLYSIVAGSPAAIGFNVGLLHGIYTLIIAFCLNWLYVHKDGSLSSTHAIRYNVNRAFAWFFLHLPTAASLLAGGHVAAASAGNLELEHPELWLLCGGLGTGLICLWLLACLNHSDDPPGLLLLPKPARLIFRPIIGIIIICLPLAHDLSLTAIMSIIMALFVLCVIWENVTSVIRGQKIWEWNASETKYPPVQDTESKPAVLEGEKES